MTPLPWWERPQWRQRVMGLRADELLQKSPIVA